ncbi:MAG TPA: hypothetical protein VMF13_04895 [Luteitalea sp.]|nr:hypothetical protein [Luteitalea sp.]
MAVRLVAACALTLWALGIWRALLSGHDHPARILRIRIPVSRAARASAARPQARTGPTRPPLPASTLLMVGVGAATLAIIGVSKGWETPFVVAATFSAMQGLGTVVWRLLAMPPGPAAVGRL